MDAGSCMCNNVTMLQGLVWLHRLVRIVLPSMYKCHETHSPSYEGFLRSVSVYFSPSLAVDQRILHVKRVRINCLQNSCFLI